MKKLHSRIRQFCFSVIMNIVPFRKVKVKKGKNCIYKIPNMVKKEGIHRLFILTTPGFLARGSLEKLFKNFEMKGITIEVFTDVISNPSIDCVEKAVKCYRKNKCQGILGIGGGAVLDCAKAVGAQIVNPKKELFQMSGLLKVRKKLPPFYVVPTTAGTGSEATGAAVITQAENHYKYTMLDPCIVPKYAFFDCQLLSTLPMEITADTGMDALTHAIESYINKFSSPKAKGYAIKSIRLIHENLLKSYENGEDLKARENMLLASYYGGLAIQNNYVGYVHALAHGIGGLYGISHGKANAILLPYVLEAYGNQIEKKLRELSKLVGKQEAEQFIQYVRDLNGIFKNPEKIQEIQRKDFSILVKRALHEANPMYPVPVIFEEKELTAILERVQSTRW